MMNSNTDSMDVVDRCVITSSMVDEDGTVLVDQEGMENDDHEEHELFQHYGVASVPPDGSESITVFIGGDRKHGVVIATENSKFRIRGMKNGEVAIYTDEGDYVHLKRNNEIHVSTKKLVASVSESANFECPDVSFSGDLSVSGNISAKGNVSAKGNISDGVGSLAELRNKYLIHTHLCAASGVASATALPQ